MFLVAYSPGLVSQGGDNPNIPYGLWRERRWLCLPANETFLISDGEDVSTTDLLRKVAAAYGKKLILFPISTGFTASVAKLVGKKTVSDRVFGTLLIDNSKARDLLGREPVITMDEQLKRIAKAER
jgi:nucleoside-diphosphate-sugar epimerase